ncbi:MAG: hypothetical protein KAI66_25775, partial [Lentisphaeria bacterium]|nr:hypothetical protein [Lentisphaeria bacterium]
MRDHDPILEREFFAIFEDYRDTERNSAGKYASGEYSLERMTPLARLAGHPERSLRVAHVAGTKGKGSTCHFLAELIRCSGRRCGMFTSPHLATVRERFHIDGELVSYEALNGAARTLEAVLRAEHLSPSLFEIMTVLALRLFVDAGCEFAVMETGIGGRLDATNYIAKPVCCGITPVSFDHMQILGHTISEIAAEKAGIIKPGVPVACARQHYVEAADVVRARAIEVGAPLHGVDMGATGWLAEGSAPFQEENFALALKMCRLMALEPDPRAFRTPELRARCECIRKTPLVVLDGAHNADSARRLAEALRHRFPGTSFVTVLGVVGGKDAAGVFEALRPVTAQFVLTNPRSPRG